MMIILIIMMILMILEIIASCEDPFSAVAVKVQAVLDYDLHPNHSLAINYQNDQEDVCNDHDVINYHDYQDDQEDDQDNDDGGFSGFFFCCCRCAGRCGAYPDTHYDKVSIMVINDQ